jgi:hypothetical protein
VPVAFVQEFDVEAGDRSTTNYDAVAAKLREQDPPDGLILHGREVAVAEAALRGRAGYTPDNVFRVCSVWESPEDAQRFTEERLMPTLQSIAGQFEHAPPPDRQYTYPLHDLQRGAIGQRDQRPG